MMSHNLRRIGEGNDTIYWLRQFTSSDMTSIYSVKVDGDDDIILGGGFNTNNEPALSKVSSSGTSVWHRYANNPAGGVQIRGVGIHSNGDDIYASGSWNRAGQNSEVLMSITDSDGNLDKHIGGRDQTDKTTFSWLGFDCTVDGSDNLWTIGTTNEPTVAIGTASNVVAMQVNSAMASLNEKYYIGDSNSNEGFSIHIGAGGQILGIATAGYASLVLMSTTTITASLKLSIGSNKMIVIDQATGGVGENYAVIQDAGTFDDAYLVQFNNSMVLQWQRKISATTEVHIPTGVVTDSSGNVYITVVQDTSVTPGQVYLAKYNSSGTQQYGRSLELTSGVPLPNKHNRLAIDSNDDLILAIPNGSIEAIIKLPSDGTLTGTYGDLTYSSATVPDAAGSLTAGTNSMTVTTLPAQSKIDTGVGYTTFTPAVDPLQPIL